ncbi:stage II sporulation protein P [Metabacillus litoralis]|uniref:stage II sporulation protein P n=1 Tax=Metabacillus TaxID=2675233 RepID=UPI001B965E86|nr:stage II sporulation protein P [Metabacillus litoralis]MCM3411390.1 stage II sporulation protein P [Metabacillus litoralis]UHA60449.1 stage II sporulation protein P [Metabacillus litoralis]
MNELSTKTLKLLLFTVVTLFLGLLTVIFFLYEKEEPRIKKGSKSGELSTKVNSNSLNSSKFMSNSSSEVSTELVPNADSLKQDAELIQEKIDSLNEMEIKRPEIKQKEFHSTFGRRIVFIYFSHTRESFLPYFKKGTAPESAYHSKVNISLVGNRLGDSLRSNGIWNDVSQVDIVNMLNNRNLTFGRSYQMSREVVVNELRENRDLEMAFDIHRDSLPREHSTIDIGGESLAKVSFVIGSGHENYKKNLDFTNGIHEVIEKKYPGLSRGVIIKDKSQGNGVYNQDLLPNSVIVEIGGVENNLEELYRSADILGNAISQYYWDKVHE